MKASFIYIYIDSRSATIISKSENIASENIPNKNYFRPYYFVVLQLGFGLINEYIIM